MSKRNILAKNKSNKNQKNQRTLSSGIAKASPKNVDYSSKIEDNLMNKILKDEIVMRSKWFFIIGSFLTSIGAMGFLILATFLANLTFFLLRQHGPMGELKLRLMITSFPWWIPFIAILFLGLGLWMLKKYDFSYKSNYAGIIAMFFILVIGSAFAVDYFGINDSWYRTGPAKKFCQFKNEFGGCRNYRNNFEFRRMNQQRNRQRLEIINDRESSFIYNQELDRQDN